MPHTFRIPFIWASLLLLTAAQASAQDTTGMRHTRFTGLIASMQSAQPVPTADIRLIYVDSVRNGARGVSGSGDVFVDSTRSRAGMTDNSGHFTFANIEPGHYLVQVRRLGFAPFEGVVTLDTAMLDMELALDQQVPLLPRVNVTASATNRVMDKLERTGFVTRSRMGTSGKFITRADILREPGRLYADEVLRKYGVFGDGVAVEIDRIPSDWDNVKSLPADLVIGVEIYRRRGTLPVEFDRTRREMTGFNEGKLVGGNATGSGGIAQTTVIIWTYIP